MALKYMQSYGIKWNYSSNFKQEIFFISPAAKHKSHFTIRFLINTATLNVYFILHYLLFFLKKRFF